MDLCTGYNNIEWFFYVLCIGLDVLRIRFWLTVLLPLLIIKLHTTTMIHGCGIIFWVVCVLGYYSLVLCKDPVGKGITGIFLLD